MSKLLQIQNALLSIDQGLFQKLCDAYLSKKYDVESISAVGSVAGKNKTRSGQPDTLLILRDGRRILVGITTETAKIVQKLSEDLASCVNPEKTGFDIYDNDRVVLACNRQLTPAHRKGILANVNNVPCHVDFLDLDQLSIDLYHQFPTLAKDLLGIELDTGQILTPIDFVENYQRHGWASRLDNTFLFRERELMAVLQSLENHDIVVINGRPGVGKSKLALECLRRIQSNDLNIKAFVITNKTLKLYDDLKHYLGADGKYVVLVDDANSLPQLRLVLEMTRERRQSRSIKLLLTVRDYVLNDVIKQAKEYHLEKITIGALSREEVRQLVQSIGIQNALYINRICDVSEGNARLAMMAGKLAIDSQRLESISDVTDIYDAYFESITSDNAVFDDEDLIQTAGIISFFGMLDRNDPHFERIARTFGLATEELWLHLEMLHEKEVLDIQFHVAKIADQILGTYFFYKVFFKDRTLDLTDLLTEFGNSHERRLVEMLSAVLSAFSFETIVKVITPFVRKTWDEVRNDEQKAMEFINLYHFTDETRYILYISDQIESLPQSQEPLTTSYCSDRVHVEITDPHLRCLRLFSEAKATIVSELIFRLLAKRPHLMIQVGALLKNDLGFDQYSHLQDYRLQRAIVSSLIASSRTEDKPVFQSLFFDVTAAYLEMKFRTSSSKGMTVFINTFKLFPRDSLYELRANMWQRLFEMNQLPQHQTAVSSILDRYSSRTHAEYLVKEVVQSDKNELWQFVLSMDPSRLTDCILANQFFQLWKETETIFDESLIPTFATTSFELFSFLYDDVHELRLARLTQESTIDLKDSLVDLFVRKRDKIVDCLKAINSYAVESNTIYKFHDGLVTALLELSKLEYAIFRDLIFSILSSGNSVGLNDLTLVAALVSDSNDFSDIYDRLSALNFQQKSVWLFGIFRADPTKRLNGNDKTILLELYKTADLRELPTDFEYLENFGETSERMIVEVVSIIFHRIGNGEGFFDFDGLFNPFGSTLRKLPCIFRDHILLLKEIFFYQFRSDRFFDHNSSALEAVFRLDRAFLVEYLNFLYNENPFPLELYDREPNWSFFWMESSAFEIFRELVILDYERQLQRRPVLRPSYLEMSLRSLTETAKNRAIDALTTLVSENTFDLDKVKYLFQMVVNAFREERNHFVEVFLTHNSHIEDFCELPFRTNKMAAFSASEEIPRIEAEIAFYSGLLPLLDSASFLKHRIEIEDRISRLRTEIEGVEEQSFRSLI